MILLVIVALLVIAAMVTTHVIVTRRLDAQCVACLKAQEIAADARADALYKQTKAANREALGKATAAAEKVQHLHDDARLMHQRVDALARDAKAAG